MSATENPAHDAPQPSSGGLTPGQAVGAGRFLLKRIVGKGGMGVVWLAQDRHLGEPVALKFLPPQIAIDEAALSDLRRETLRSRKLSHANIVRIHDFFQAGQEPPFISMEFVDGPNLHFLRESRPLKVLTWKFMVPLVRQLCLALTYAHAEKVVHRDLKPANLMLDSSGRLKLADFGLARVAHDSMTRRSGMTLPGGTINFMSPQQADGKPAQIADDIYSLGATLYDLLTSRPPFYQGDVGYQVRHTRPEPMPQRLAELELTNEIPSEASALVMACLGKEPEQRPASVQVILDYLDAAEKDHPAELVSHQTAAPPPTASSLPVEVATPTPAPAPGLIVPSLEFALPPGAPVPDEAEEIGASSSGEATRPQSSSVGLVLVGVVALVLAVVAGVGWYLKAHLRIQTTETSPTNLVVAAKPMESAPKPPPPGPVDAQGFVLLFNGRDLSGWDGDRRWWSVVDGAIQGRFTNRVGGKLSALVFRGGTVNDFELRLSFRSSGGSGEVLYRAQESLDHDITGYVCMLTGNGRANRYYPGGSSGGLTIPSRTVKQTTEIQQNQATAMRQDDWNEMTIIVRSNRLRHELNGRLVDEVCDTRSTQLSSGLLALAMPCAASDRSQRIQIKDIRLKRLSPAPLPPPQPSPAPSPWSGYNPNIHHSGAVNALAFAPEGEWVASAGQDGTVRLWNSKTGLVGPVLRGHAGAVLAVAFAPGQSDLLASGSADKTIKLWNRRSNTCQATWKGHEGVIRALAFAADGKTLITGSEDQTIKRWEAPGGRQLANAEAHQGGVLTMALSPDGKLLATGGADGIVKVWDAQTLGLRDTFQKHGRPVTSLAFSSDSRTLASAAGDTSIQFWDLVARRLGSSATPAWPVRSLAFWPDDTSVVFGSDDNALRVHSLTGGSQRTVVVGLGMAGAFSVSTQGVLTYGCQNGFVGYQRR